MEKVEDRRAWLTTEPNTCRGTVGAPSGEGRKELPRGCVSGVVQEPQGPV